MTPARRRSVDGRHGGRRVETAAPPWQDSAMNFDPDKVDEAVLGLLWLTSFRHRDSEAWSAWRGHD